MKKVVLEAEVTYISILFSLESLLFYFISKTPRQIKPFSQ